MNIRSETVRTQFIAFSIAPSSQGMTFLVNHSSNFLPSNSRYSPFLIRNLWNIQNLLDRKIFDHSLLCNSSTNVASGSNSSKKGRSRMAPFNSSTYAASAVMTRRIVSRAVTPSRRLKGRSEGFQEASRIVIGAVF